MATSNSTSIYTTLTDVTPISEPTRRNNGGGRATGEASEIRNRGSYRGNGGSTHGTWTVRNKGSLSPWKRPRAESNEESARTSVGGFRWRMAPYYRGSRVMLVEGRGPDPHRARMVAEIAVIDDESSNTDQNRSEAPDLAPDKS